MGKGRRHKWKKPQAFAAEAPSGAPQHAVSPTTAITDPTMHEWTPADEEAFDGAVERNEPAEALAICEREHPRTGRTRFRMASMYRWMNQWAEIRALLAGSIAQTANARAWLWLAEAYVDGGTHQMLADAARRTSALGALDHAMAAEDCPARAFELRWWWRGDEPREQARVFLERGLAATGDVSLRQLLANELRISQEYAAVIDVLTPLFATELPVDADADSRSAWQWTFWLSFAAYRKIGDLLAALTMLRRFEAPDDNGRAVQQVMVGQVLEEMGDIEGAAAAYEAAFAAPSAVETTTLAGVLRLWSWYRRDGASPVLARALDVLFTLEDVAADWTTVYLRGLWVAQLMLSVNGCVEACATWARDDALPISEETRARLLFQWVTDLMEVQGWEATVDKSDLLRRVDQAAAVTRDFSYLDAWSKVCILLGAFAKGVRYGLTSNGLTAAGWMAKNPDATPPTYLAEVGWHMWPEEPLTAANQAAVRKAALAWWKKKEHHAYRAVAIRTFYTRIWRDLLIDGQDYPTLRAVTQDMIDDGGAPSELREWYFDCGLACQRSSLPDEAVTNYRAAMNNGHSPGSAFNLSIIEEQRGELGNALAWTKQALEWAPDWKIVPPRIAAIEARISKLDAPPPPPPRVYPRFRPSPTPAPAPAPAPAAPRLLAALDAPPPPAAPGTSPADPADTRALFRQRPPKESTGRQAISKKLRYEVFKRDGFKCVYCGEAAPKVVLHVDHVHPVAEGGTNDLLNLVSSCQDCNLGKGARRLDDSSAVAKSRAQLDELQARQEQVDMMLAWQKGLKTVAADTLDQVAEYWNDLTPGWMLSESGLKALKRLLRKFSLPEVLQAMDIAADQYLEKGEDGKLTQTSVAHAQGKIGGICSVRQDSKNDPDLLGLLYIRKILMSELSYCDSRQAMEDLRAARSWGVPMADLKSLAKSVSSWTRFQREIDRVIERAQEASGHEGAEAD